MYSGDPKAAIQSRVVRSIKALQERYARSDVAVGSGDADAESLCCALEAAFVHGLRERCVGAARGGATGGRRPLPQPSFWELLKGVTHSAVIRELEQLPFICTAVGRCRAWLRLALNDAVLPCYVGLLLRDPALPHFYRPTALLVDADAGEVLLSFLRGLTALRFRLSYKSAVLNEWTPTPLALSGLCPDPDDPHAWGEAAPRSRGADVGRGEQPASPSPSPDASGSPPPSRSPHSARPHGAHGPTRRADALPHNSEPGGAAEPNPKLDPKQNPSLDTDPDPNPDPDPDASLQQVLLEFRRAELSSVTPLERFRPTALPPKDDPREQDGIPAPQHAAVGQEGTAVLSPTAHSVSAPLPGGPGSSSWISEDDFYRPSSGDGNGVPPHSSVPNGVPPHNSVPNGVGIAAASGPLGSLGSREPTPKWGHTAIGAAQHRDGDPVFPAEDEDEDEDEDEGRGPSAPLRSGTSSRRSSAPRPTDTDPAADWDPDPAWDWFPPRCRLPLPRVEPDALKESVLLAAAGSAWRPFIFSLSPRALKRFHVRDGRKVLRDRVAVESLRDVVPAWGVGGPACFVLVTSGAALRLRAGSAREAALWRTALRGALRPVLEAAEDALAPRGAVDGRCAALLSAAGNDAFLLRFLVRVPAERGLGGQGFTCAGCSRRIGLSFAKPKLCAYSGHYYCDRCHRGDRSIIPSRLLHNWDLSERGVCRQALKFLTQIRELPLIDVRAVNESLYEHAQDMARVRRSREELKLLGERLSACPRGAGRDLRQRLRQRGHLLECPHTYSVADLQQIGAGSFEALLRGAIQFAELHIRRCDHCAQSGATKRGDSATRCSECGSRQRRRSRTEVCDRERERERDEEEEEEGEGEGEEGRPGPTP